MTKRQALEYFEYVFTIAAMLLYGGSPLQLILTGGASEGGGRAFTEPDFAIIRLLCMVTYMVFGLLLVYRWKQALYGLYKARVIIALTVFALLSYFWSDFPSFTMNRGIALIGTTLFGIYLGTRFTLKQQLKLLGIAYGIIVLLSLAFVIALPYYGIMGGIHAGSWRGIYVHKNVMGRAMVFGSIILLALASEKRGNRMLPWFLFGICGLFILMSRSATALGNFLFLTVAFYVLRTTRWRYDLRLLSLILLILIGGTLYSLFLANLETILGSFGKDTTLTGRTDLWPLVIQMIERHPILGYGYQGFWQGWNSPAGEIWANYGWNAPHAHNGFLDLTLELGLVGLGLFLFEAFTILLLGILRLQRTQTFDNFLCVLVPLFFLLYNMTESSILGRNTLFWVVFIAIAISVRIPIPIPESRLPEPDPPVLLKQQYNS